MTIPLIKNAFKNFNGVYVSPVAANYNKTVIGSFQQIINPAQAVVFNKVTMLPPISPISSSIAVATFGTANPREPAVSGFTPAPGIIAPAPTVGVTSSAAPVPISTMGGTSPR